MPLSKVERDALVERVEQEGDARGGRRGAVVDAIDHERSRLSMPDESSSAKDVLPAPNAESMPHLAARVVAPRTALHPSAALAAGGIA